MTFIVRAWAEHLFALHIGGHWLVKQTAYALGFKTSGGWASLLATAGIDYAVHEGELSETPLKIV